VRRLAVAFSSPKLASAFRVTIQINAPFIAPPHNCHRKGGVELVPREAGNPAKKPHRAKRLPLRCFTRSK
jgi:hypothetical protein